MTTEERNAAPNGRRPGWPLAAFGLIWLLLVLGVPVLAVLGALQDLRLPGSEISGDPAAQRAIWLVAIGAAFALPLLGLGLALWQRRKIAAIVFGVTLLVFSCGLVVPANRASSGPNSLVEWMFPSLVQPEETYPDSPGGGCMGEPGYLGNCKGG